MLWWWWWWWCIIVSIIIILVGLHVYYWACSERDRVKVRIFSGVCRKTKIVYFFYNSKEAKQLPKGDGTPPALPSSPVRNSPSWLYQGEISLLLPYSQINNELLKSWKILEGIFISVFCPCTCVYLSGWGSPGTSLWFTLWIEISLDAQMADSVSGGCVFAIFWVHPMPMLGYFLLNPVWCSSSVLIELLCWIQPALNQCDVHPVHVVYRASFQYGIDPMWCWTSVGLV